MKCLIARNSNCATQFLLSREDLPGCSLSTYYLQAFGRMRTILSEIVLAHRRETRINGSIRNYLWLAINFTQSQGKHRRAPLVGRR